MSGPFLTIGMAVYDDYDGVYFTIQDLRINHALTDCEIVVVDNHPHSRAGARTKRLIEKLDRKGNMGARYVAMPDKQGTTQPRQRVFDEARGEWVLCLDSHVLLMPKALDRLLAWCFANGDSRDIVSGPLMYDDAESICGTELLEQWRGGMWGIWHTDDRGRDPNGDPYEVWAQGLGLFAMRRAAWPGFDPRWRGFGGEEGYIHDKVRRAGGRALCLPGVRWLHRFNDHEDVGYPAPIWQKVRNNVLGHLELNLDVEPIRRHFVEDIKAMRPTMWTALMRDPERETEPGVAEYRRIKPHTPPPVPITRPTRPSVWPQPESPMSLDDVFEWGKATPRDLEQHFDTLKMYSSECEHVVEITKRRESTIALLAGRPKILDTFTLEPDAVHDTLHWLVNATNPLPLHRFSTHIIRDTIGIDVEVPECDLLYIDSVHHAQRLLAELTLYGGKATKYLVLRGTAAFGEHAEGSEDEGLYFGLMRWFERDGRPWVRVFRDDRQYGLSIYSPSADAISVDVGPGTELAAMLREMSIQAGHTCDCRAKAAIMDQRGVDGCRATRDEIAGWLRDGAARWKWPDKIKAAIGAARQGFAHRLNPLDPYPGLVDVAIERAEKTLQRNAEIIASQTRSPILPPPLDQSLETFR